MPGLGTLCTQPALVHSARDLRSMSCILERQALNVQRIFQNFSSPNLISIAQVDIVFAFRNRSSYGILISYPIQKHGTIVQEGTYFHRCWGFACVLAAILVQIRLLPNFHAAIANPAGKLPPNRVPLRNPGINRPHCNPLRAPRISCLLINLRPREQKYEGNPQLIHPPWRSSPYGDLAVTVRVEDENSANHTVEDFPATLFLSDAITESEPHPFNLSFK
jgi:hypothetical protein